MLYIDYFLFVVWDTEIAVWKYRTFTRSLKFRQKSDVQKKLEYIDNFQRSEIRIEESRARSNAYVTIYLFPSWILMLRIKYTKSSFVQSSISICYICGKKCMWDMREVKRTTVNLLEKLSWFALRYNCAARNNNPKYVDRCSIRLEISRSMRSPAIPQLKGKWRGV